MSKRVLLLCASAALFLSSCDGWPFSSGGYSPPTPVPSSTPLIETATPLILSPAPLTATLAASTETATISAATATLVEATPSEAVTPTLLPTVGSVTAQILGCDTSIDILHGMGAVTNAYVKIMNTTASPVPQFCATLNALDEGRPHPDKIKCLPTLPAGYQVTFKLTVDTTFKEKTPVQVDVTSGNTLLVRVGEPACTAIDLLPPDIDNLDLVKPIP